ncbi:tetratricopeptide repeat protein [Candidatus Methylobacter oryzae]|uniref:Tetratricopeptide repeat protein n=1 Tax=Candidatus Methylobacter oryzae TaxID=2497749 RepID=A0ABY3C8C6_9GAMM|nr:tetratricopeptide repeat protein [Candidatus Methylobacter oryzae]TRW89945.1 tetratricopeptide repeat protein [Candidatus Methylobacter oryzae]
MYGGQAKGQKPSRGSRAKAQPSVDTSKEIVQTQPLKDISEIKSEPLAPIEQPLLPEPAPVETTPVETPEPSAPVLAPAPSSSSVSEAPQRSLPAAPPPTPQLAPFEPIQPTVPLSPVVGALVSAANQNSKAGDLDSAAASIERAIRIEPRNANLFYKLALLRLQQSKPRLAEDLAKKSALLASTDNTLKKHCWLLIAHAKELQHDFTGAKEARAKAESF